MSEATLDVVINSIANTTGFATAKAELAAMGGGGFTPLGGGTVNYGGSLTREEQAMAAGQLGTYETRARAATAASKELGIAERDLASEGNAVARAASSMGVAGAEAGGRLTALGGVMGSTGALGLGIGAAIIGLGGTYEALKSIVEISDADEAAKKNLTNAYSDLGKAVPTKRIDDFIEKNKAFIPSIAAVTDGFAQLARAGFDGDMATRIMTDAMDLAAAKGIDFGAALKDIILAENGQSRALLDLGINIKTMIDPAKDLAQAHKEISKAMGDQMHATRELQEWEARHHDRSKLTEADLMHEEDLKGKVSKGTRELAQAHKDLALAQQEANDKGNKSAQVLDQIEAKTKGAHKSSSDLHQAQTELNTDWQMLADNTGPGLTYVLTNVVSGADFVVEAFTRGLEATEKFAQDSAQALDIWEVRAVGAINNVIEALDRLPGVNIPTVKVVLIPGSVGGSNGGRSVSRQLTAQ